MTRVTSGPARRARKKAVLQKAKGFRGRRKNVWKVATQAVDKANQYAYRDRRRKKRDFRRLWIIRINAAARMHNTTYGRLIAALHAHHILIDRKQLAHLAVDHPEHFAQLLTQCNPSPNTQEALANPQ